MQLFPRDGHGFARLQVLHTTSYFFVPSCLHGFVRGFETVEQGVGQCSALVRREGEGAFEEVRNFGIHGAILPRVGCFGECCLLVG